MPGADLLQGPLPLDAAHDVEQFDSGARDLDDYLKRRALSDQRAGKSRTFVALRAGRVVAFFSLAAASIEPVDATERAARGQGAQPIPAILVARLAVDAAEQGHGLGGAMLVEALARCAQAAGVVGARVVLVHAKTAGARLFYERFGFEPSPTHPLHLILLMKDVRRSLS